MKSHDQVDPGEIWFDDEVPSKGYVSQNLDSVVEMIIELFSSKANVVEPSANIDDPLPLSLLM